MSNWSIPAMNAELPIDPPEETVVGQDWLGYEVYGYQEGYMIEGEFVPEDDVREYIKDNYTLVRAEDIKESL